MNSAERRKNPQGRHARHLAGWLILICLLMAGCAASRGSTQPVQDAALTMEEQWGVKVLAIRLSAEGYMLDFRYRVLNPEKAAPLFDRKIKPHLVDQATGATMAVPEPPKVGALRTTRKPQPDRTYFIMFANPGRHVQKGRMVTVVIGGFRAENLVVE